MDSESDFLNAEFLYILLFEAKNLLIYPFTYASKLQALKDAVDPLFKIEEFDISNINSVEIFQLYCSNVASVLPQVDNSGITTKKPLIIFEKGMGEFFPEIKHFPALQFIALEKGIDLKSPDPNTISYNKKLHEFDNFTMEGKSKEEKDAMDYCKFLVSENNFDVSISVFSNKVTELTQILSDFSVLRYKTFTESTNEIELAVCKIFCEKYFYLNPGAVLPDQATLNESFKSLDPQQDGDLEMIAKTEQEIEQSEKETPAPKKSRPGSKVPTATKGKPHTKDTLDPNNPISSEPQKETKTRIETPKEIQATIKSIPESNNTNPLKVESSESSSEANDFDNEQSDEYRYFLELAKLREDAEIYIIFEHQLVSVTVENSKATTPETKYEFLRKHQWKEGIPFNFLIQLLHQFLLQLAKMNPAKFNGIASETSIKEEYEKILHLFMNCDIDEDFTKYSKVKDYICKIFALDKSNPNNTEIHVLPIYRDSKSTKKVSSDENNDRINISSHKSRAKYNEYFERLAKKYPQINAESINAILNETTNLIKSLKKTEV